MLKYGTNTIGKLYFGSNSIGKAYYGSNLVFQSGSSPTPPTPTTVSFTMSSADLFAGITCGGFINATSGKWTSSSSYYGVIVDLGGFEGGEIEFVRSVTSTLVRYAFLTSGTFDDNTSVGFSVGTTLVTNSDDQTFSVTIPTDGHYIFIYIYAAGTNVAPTTTVTAAKSSKYVNLESSLFATNTTVGTNGTVYTGSSAPGQVCSSYLAVSEYAYCLEAEIIVNGLPTGVDYYTIAIAEYTSNKVFIRRDNYTDAPFTVSLDPTCCFVRYIVVCRANNQDLSGDVVRFSGNMIQVKTIDTE